MRLLLFGFEAFGAEPINPSERAVRALEGQIVDGVRLEALVLPVVYGSAFSMLEQRLHSTPAPCAVMGVGQGNLEFQIEQTARNHAGPKSDNRGLCVHEVEMGGPERVRSTWPAQAIVDAVQETEPGAPVVFSDDAGDFLCNHTLFRLLRWNDGRAPCGFLHVPKRSVVSQAGIDRAVAAAAFTLAKAARPLRG